MTRQLRPDHPNTLHHVTNRGQRKADIFLDADDAEFFLELLGKACEKFNVKIRAFCLMRNHFHLVVDCPDGNLGRTMHFLEFRYAQRFNYWHGFSGPVFTDRYHSTVIESDSQLRQTLRYVERNPLEVGNEIVNHPWGSFGICLGLRAAPAWLDIDAVSSLFGSRQAYWTFVTDDQPTDKASYVEGSAQFVAPQRVWRSSYALGIIDDVVAVSLPEVASARLRTTENRDIALLMATDRGIDASDIATRFNMSRSAVRTALSRLRARAGSDLVTSSWIAAARRALEAAAPRP